MITLRKRLAGPRSRFMLLPALLFLGGACVAAFGGTQTVMLCLLPASLAIATASHAAEPGKGGG